VELRPEIRLRNEATIVTLLKELQLPTSMADEPEELVRFREAWRAELEQRKVQPSTSIGSSASQDKEPSALDVATSGGVVSAPSTSALEIYRRAVQHEQQSQLSDALRLYRQAFRMDPDVDKVYRRQEHLFSVTSHISFPKKLPRDEVERGYSAQATAKASTVTGTLASLTQAFPTDAGFEPEDERKPIPIKSLPDELLILILRKLDPLSIEHFASVSRKARVMGLDSVIWR
jgi:F-box protein 9